MSDYTSSNVDKENASLKKKKNIQDNLSTQQVYAESPFESANDTNPFGGEQGTNNPFISSANTPVIQQKTIQMNRERSNAFSKSKLKTRERSNAISEPKHKTRERSNAVSIPNDPNSSALIGANTKIDGIGENDGDLDSFDALKTADKMTTSIHGQFASAKNSDNTSTFDVPEELSNTIGLANGIFTMASGFKGLLDPKSDGFDKAMSAITIAQGGAGMLKTFQDISEGSGSDVAKVVGIVNSGLGVIKNGISIVKQIKKIKEGVEEGGKAKAAFTLASTIVQVGIDVAKIAQQIYKYTDTAVPGALEAAIPGLGIVLSSISIIQQSVEIAHALQNFKSMSSRKKDLKKDLQDSNPEIFTSEKKGLLGRFRSKDRTVDTELNNATKIEGAGGDTAREYALAREFKKINRKRIIRASINISADALSIAGDIATLSGVAAGVGVGLKVGAAGVKGGVGLARYLKQKARDSDMKFTDQSKTSDAKHDKRISHIKFIFQMMQDLKPYDPDKNAKAIRIKTYIEGSGANYNDFIQKNATPKGAAKYLYDSMKKREA